MTEFGKQMAGVWKSKLDLHEKLHPNVPMAAAVSGCVHHCDMWGLVQVDGKTTNQLFHQWYLATLKWWQEGSQGTAPRMFKAEDAAFPCTDCCPYDISQ